MKPQMTLLIGIFQVFAFADAGNAQVPPFNEPAPPLAFTDAEKTAHRTELFEILKESANCIRSVRDKNNAFRSKYGVSPYFGPQSGYSKLSSQKTKSQYLQNSGNLTPLAKSLGVNKIVAEIDGNAISCVGFAMRCLKQGFESRNQGDYWARIAKFAESNKIDGAAIQEGLRRLGWTTAYWNPDTSKNSQWDSSDEMEGLVQSARGFHEQRYNQVQKSSAYWQNKIDDADSFVNFRTETPEPLNKIPFMIATAHSGYHVFILYYGYVFEASAGASPDQDVVSVSKFGPLSGGAPDGYYSGIFAVPPGQWD